MAKLDINRRQFLMLSGAVAASAFIGISCDGGGSSQTDGGGFGSIEVYRLSLRGKRGSKAAKSHNANKLFLTPQAADQNRAHPGDNSRIVSVVLSEQRFNEFFDGGALEMVDLRAIL